MKQVLFLILLLTIFPVSVFSQSNKAQKPKREITVCKIELTEAGKTANFHFNYIYLLTTDVVGDVDKVEQIHKDNPEFVQDEKFMTCIKSWKLKPVNKYAITISFGTTSAEDFILISHEEEKIKIIL